MLPIEGQPILTAAGMKAAEAASGSELSELMARAGEGVAAAVARLAAGRELLVLCGPGNNGGDGYVAAAALRRAGLAVRVAASGEPSTDLARRAREGWSGGVERLADAGPGAVLVDALFGTGMSRPLDAAIAGPLAALVGAAQLAIAVDLPSGVATDTGEALGAGSAVDVTLALGAVKPAHLLEPAASLCGAVRLLDIGVAAASDACVVARPALAVPAANSQKYTRGMVVLVGGAMAGAGDLAAEAAMRAGAGYGLLLSDAPAPAPPHALVRRRWSPEALDDDRIGAVVIGPGLGRDAAARAKLDAALATAHPLLIDGDALRLLDLDRLAARTGPTVLTPHGGEFRHLFGDPGAEKIGATVAAARCGAVVVNKGADTVIAAPGGQVRIHPRGSSWLSTAGTGDVLAGTIGAMLAGGLAPLDAAAAGVWLHADAARRCGASFVADDLARALTAARAQISSAL